MLFVLVGAAYLALTAIGFVVGRLLSTRKRNDGPPQGGIEPGPGPGTPPAFGLEWEPLGSSLDRELFPGVLFDDAPVPA